MSLILKKMLAKLELPLLPELRAALLDYLENARPDVGDDIVFRVSYPPYDLMSKSGAIACFRRAIFKSRIEIGNRGYGPRAFRSSLASSMVNDGAPYEAVRKALGHIDQNAISHYARLDIEQLRFYALPVLKTTGTFADFLAGRGAAK
jgi:integrase